MTITILTKVTLARRIFLVTNVALCFSFSPSYSMLQALKNTFGKPSYDFKKGDEACTGLRDLRNTMSRLISSSDHVPSKIQDDEREFHETLQLSSMLCDARKEAIPHHQEELSGELDKKFIELDEHFTEAHEAAKDRVALFLNIHKIIDSADWSNPQYDTIPWVYSGHRHFQPQRGNRACLGLQDLYAHMRAYTSQASAMHPERQQKQKEIFSQLTLGFITCRSRSQLYDHNKHSLAPEAMAALIAGEEAIASAYEREKRSVESFIGEKLPDTESSAVEERPNYSSNGALI